MISIYAADEKDFSSNGLCALTPSSCQVSLTLNGEWELILTHPLDDQVKYAWLQAGCVLKAPVPVDTSPRLGLLAGDEGKDIYRIFKTGAQLKLYSKPNTTAYCIGRYSNKTEVQVLSKTNPSYFEVITPDGKRGYLASADLLYQRTASSAEQASREILQPMQAREQPFRIYRVVPELTQVSVYARHLSYDLMDNMIYSYKPAKGTNGAVAAVGILGSCQTSHPFSVFSNLTLGVDDLSIENTNPLDAILGEGGLVDRTGCELARDWFDLYLLKRVGKDRDLQIRQGKNLLGIRYDVDDSNVTTRIVPTGEDAEGELLYLDERYIDSPYLANYTHPRWVHLPVSEARVSDDMTISQVKAKLRLAAQDEFDKGCDLPDVSIDVSFIHLENTVEYAQYQPLDHLFIGDGVRVIVKTHSLNLPLRVTESSFDVLLERYLKMTLGSASKTLAGSMISPRQLPAGGIKGMKLAMGAIGTGHLQTASIGSLQVKAAAIGAAHIQQAAIGEAHIQDAVIGSAKIADAAITETKIGQASITTAHITDAAITSAKIGQAEVTSANIADLSVTAGKIAYATITGAQIADAAIGNANIGDAAITGAKIGLAAVGSAQIADLAVTVAHIADAAVSTAKIHQAAITEAKIQDAAITRAKIAQAAVGTAQIDDAAITSAKIGQVAIETAHIGTGVVGTEQVADGSITDAKIVGLTANKITAGTIDAADINVVNLNAGNITVGTINGQQIAPGAISGLHIGNNVITDRMIQDGSIGGSKISIGTIAAEKLKLSQHLLY